MGYLCFPSLLSIVRSCLGKCCYFYRFTVYRMDKCTGLATRASKTVTLWSFPPQAESCSVGSPDTEILKQLLPSPYPSLHPLTALGAGESWFRKLCWREQAWFCTFWLTIVFEFLVFIILILWIKWSPLEIFVSG